MGGTALIDLEIVSSKDGEVRARLPVSDTLKQPLGLVHGGVYALIAEQLTVDGGRAISNQTNFLRPVTAGAIPPVARRGDNGRTTSVWEVEITDDAGRLCALVRITVAA